MPAARSPAENAGVSNDEPAEESSVWKDRPSQLLNLPHYLAAGLIGIALLVLTFAVSGYIAIGILIPLGFIVWKYFSVRCQIFELTTERLRFYSGVLNQDIDEIELYRVKDSRILKPLWQRVFGLGTVVLETSDRTHPNPVIPAIQEAAEVREEIRKHVEALRDKKRVREVDFDQTGESEFGDEVG